MTDGPRAERCPHCWQFPTITHSHGHWTAACDASCFRWVDSETLAGVTRAWNETVSKVARGER
jgi:hypothetical protein